MATIILSIMLFGIIMAGMAVGLILQGKPIKGSCGGISALGMGTACDICGGDTRQCEKDNRDIGEKVEKSGERSGKADFYQA